MCQEGAQNDGIPASVLREIVILKRLNAHNHPNILRLQGVYRDPGRISLVFDLMDGDLAWYLRSTTPDEPTRRLIMHGFMRGMKFLHENDVIHRDLKPANILMRGTTPVIADFGLSRSMSVPAPQLTANVVAALYRAPELHLGSTNYDTSIDIWSCGLIMAEIYGTMLFHTRRPEDVLELIFQKMSTPTPAIWPGLVNLPLYRPPLPEYPGQPLENLVPDVAVYPDALDLLRMMIVYDPTQRITAAQSLQHVYFREI
eukprot:TRINITY_DN1784_c0_g4_i1.p1 TRINITY_DN1784_c0_g4~~TRINITY_DN1784_c0_g4_i1.p1  ORF type:complete len:257 (-),score=54.37 TRINITY_DN1784_c0_g4_i1:432-1202(-)